MLYFFFFLYLSVFMFLFFFFFNDTATTEIYTLSLHDALPISWPRRQPGGPPRPGHRDHGHDVLLAAVSAGRVAAAAANRRPAGFQLPRRPPAVRWPRPRPGRTEQPDQGES